MRKTQCFVIKRGTDYDKAVKKHLESLPRWNNVFKKVSELLGEKITKMAFHPTRLVIDRSEIKNEETLNLFKKDGELKANSNKVKDILEDYKQIVKDEGLAAFEELRVINFRYGVMRMRGQMLESFITQENDIYYKADFDLAARCNGLVIPISEIEYHETYLNEIKKRESEAIV